MEKLEKIIKYKAIDIDHYSKLYNNIIAINKLKELKELGFVDDECLFVLPNYNTIVFRLEDLINIRESFWVYIIEGIKNKIFNRSCFTCKLNTVCFAYISIKEILVKLPVNIDTDEAPGTHIDVFKALAGCCLVYEENN